MGFEILKEGIIIVNREKAGDAHILRSILNGEWTYEYLMGFAKSQEEMLEQAYLETDLPRSPDRSFFNDLCVDIVESYLYEQ